MDTNNIIIDGISYRLVKNEPNWKTGEKFIVTDGRYKDKKYTVDLVLENGLVSVENSVGFLFEQIEKIV